MNTFINNDKLFITEEVFKSMVPSSRGTSDTQTIYYSIALSQQQTIKEIFGRDLYEYVLNQYTLYVDSGITMEEHYSTLMDNYLKPILAFSTYKRLINNLSFKLKEGGLRYTIDQTTELAQYQDRQYIISEITNDINHFIGDMKHYILENVSYFPLYNQGFVGAEKQIENFGIGKVSNGKRNIYESGSDIRKNYYPNGYRKY